MEEKSSTQNQQNLNEQGNKEKSKKSRKAIILPILIVIVLAAGCAGLYYFSISRNYFSTDNAKVTAKMYTITPNMAGELLEWNAKEGERVDKNQILGRQGVLPYITSPIAGTVVENNGIEGQMVSPATQLAVVADTDNLYIGVNIEETDIIKIKVGQTVDVKIDAYPGKTFKGVVSDIDRTTQTYFSGTSSFSTSGTYTKVTQLIPVKVLIENKDNLPLTFGMNATVKIHIKENPSSAALKNNNPETTASKSGNDYSSSIEAADQMAVTPNVSGKVSAINVNIGQKVEKGEVLFVLDSTDLELQVKQAAANVVPAQAAYDDAAANYARLQELFKAGAISQVDLDGGKTKVDTTQAQMEGAKAALELAQKKVTDCVVKAPMSGEVAFKNITVGDMASPQAAAITLINAQNVKVHINVTETYISKVKIGTKADINIQAIGAVAQGTVVSIAPASDPKTGMFPVEILVKNTDGKLKPGMMADVKLQTE